MSTLEKSAVDMPVKISNAAAAADGLELPHCSLNRRVALGLMGSGEHAEDTWVVLDFTNGRAQLLEIRQCAKLPDPDSALDVEVAILASVAVWTEIGEGGHAAAIAAADKHELAVSGKLVYFIRHVRSSVDLIAKFGKLLHAAST